MSFIFV